MFLFNQMTIGSILSRSRRRALDKEEILYFDCRTLCSLNMSGIRVKLHVDTGCDAISSFFGQGKKSVMKLFLKTESPIYFVER